MKLFVCGHGRHGKDTVSEILKTCHGFTFSPTSFLAAELFIFEKIKNDFGYKTVDECYKDRFNRRDLWFNLISEYNRDNPGRFALEVFNKVDIYCGIRCDKEFYSALAQRNDIKSIWVDASLRKPLEPPSSMRMRAEYCDASICNNLHDPTHIDLQLNVGLTLTTLKGI